MSYADSLLGDGEQVLMRSRQHWLGVIFDSGGALGLWLIAIVIIIAVRLFNITGDLANLLGIAALVALGVGLVMFIWRFFVWTRQEYLITDRRLLQVEGILHKSVSDTSLIKINDARLNEGILGRMLNYADLDILTASGDAAVDEFRMLHGAKEFRRTMNNQKNALEMGYVQDRPAPPFRAADAPALPSAAAPLTDETTAQPSPAPAATPPATAQSPAAPATAADDDESLEITRTLARLADLKASGAISEAEYEAKKAELLARL
jgi:membrane protein YdbS with pleckstrin-like domain